MRDRGSPDLSLFLDILYVLDDLGVPYMVIGAFAGIGAPTGIVYGMTRVT